MITEKDVNAAFENEFDGVEKFLLVQEILELREKHRWIPTSERLPEACKAGCHPKQSERVWLARNKDVFKAYYDYYWKSWYDIYGVKTTGTHYRFIILPKAGE